MISLIKFGTVDAAIEIGVINPQKSVQSNFKIGQSKN
jgi:hypothetical protein